MFSLKYPALNMGAEYGFQTKQQLNECILRCPWSEHPLPPVYRACRDGDVLSLTYLTIQGDRLAVFRSINAHDPFLMWTPVHWAAYFGKVSLKIKRNFSTGVYCFSATDRLIRIRSKSQFVSFSCPLHNR